MREQRVESIFYPKWFRGLRPNHVGFPKAGYRVLAFDTETVQGWPYTLQVHDGQKGQLWYLKPPEFMPTLIRWLRPYVDGHRQNVVLFGFNLSFDLVALLYPHARRFSEGTFELRCAGAIVTVFYGKIPFAKIRFPNRRTVWIVDAFAFVWCSLARAAKTWGLPMPKLARPKELGRRLLRGSVFERYAMRDAEVTHALGEKIIQLHQRFNCRVCVSIAQLSGRIFAHHFLQQPLSPTPDGVRDAALLAYHGGKNGFYSKKPRWVDCREYDLRSAYPWAMSQLPHLSGGDWKEVRHVDRQGEGFYQVSGDAANDKWPALYDHAFYPLRGKFNHVWVTSFELREALRSGEVLLRRVRGYVWKPRGRGLPHSPLAQFCSHFYDAKEHAAPGPEREQYKLILNSLYGKFIQLTPMPEGEKPGAYFHPVLAAWTTGLVRARMHQLEHELQALHTATDAIHSRRRIPDGKGLGSIHCVQDGPALLLRNKVYFHFSRDGRDLKYARHGIRMPVRKLWRALVAGRRQYRITHLLRPREAAVLGTRPLQAVQQSITMNLSMPAGPMPWQAKRFWKGGKS